MTFTVSAQRAQEVHDLARARDGLYYGYGQAFTKDPRQSTDCSGLVLQTAAWYGGRTDWPGNRYGSTESFRLDYDIVYKLGFKRFPRGGLHAIPIKPVMLVGLQHGGGGVYSHTACTLMTMDKPGGPVVQSARGVDWESMGDGVRLYDLARAWNDRLFHDFWFLDAVLQPAVVVNEIDAEYARAKSWIGARKTGEVKTADGTGLYSDFEGGRIYFKSTVRSNRPAGDRAVSIPTHILETYSSVGSSAGPLGYPRQRHAVLPAGDVQEFERGMIYRRHGQDGVVVHGAILNRYRAVGFEKGWGWPVGPELPTSEGGRSQRFEKRTALWHPSAVPTVEVQ